METLQTVFDVLVVICVTALVMGAGLVSDIDEIRSYFAGERLQLTLRLLIVNAVAIPALAFPLLWLLPLEPTSALILFVLAIAPAAPVLPPLVHAVRGDVNWSISMLCLLTMISLITIPAVVSVMVHSEQSLVALKSVSGRTLFIGYVLPVLIPLFLGMTMKHFRPDRADALFPYVDKLGKWLNLPLFILIMTINWASIPLVNLMDLGMVLGVLGVFSLIGVLSIYPGAAGYQYLTAFCLTGLRNFAILFLLLNLLTEDKIAIFKALPVSLGAILTVFIIGFFWGKKLNPSTF